MVCPALTFCPTANVLDAINLPLNGAVALPWVYWLCAEAMRLCACVIAACALVSSLCAAVNSACARCQLFADSGRIDNDQRITGMHLISLGNQHLRDFALNSQAKFFRIARSRFTAALDISANIAIGNDCSRPEV